MKRVAVAVVLLALVSAAACGGEDKERALESLTEDGGQGGPGDASKGPTFAIWVSPNATGDTKALRALLGELDSKATVEVFTNVEPWLASGAEVFVMRGSDDGGIPIPDRFLAEHDFGGLVDKRVLGIGWEANRVFGALGLEVDSATIRGSGKLVALLAPDLVPGKKPNSRFVAYEREQPEERGDNGSSGVHIPSWSHLNEYVEVIARWVGDPNYAPITRQGSYVYVGIGADLSTWTEELRNTVAHLAARLRTMPAKLPLASWPVTRPGTYEFKLASSGHLQFPSSKSFFFKFSGPTLFSVHLEIEASDEVMMFFRATKSNRDHDRLDSNGKRDLRLLMPIVKPNIEANGDRYWELDITNFGWPSGARCKLHVRYETDATLALLDGSLPIPMSAPPKDAKTIDRIIKLFLRGNAREKREARAALVIIGKAALGQLESAEEGETIENRVNLSMLADDIRESAALTDD